MNENFYDSSKIDIEKLRVQFSGKKFKELIQEHVRKQKIEQSYLGLKGTIELIKNNRLQELCEEVASTYLRQAEDINFWNRDCGKVLFEVYTTVKKQLELNGYQYSSKIVFDTFQMIVLSFTITAQNSKEFRKFINIRKGVFQR